MTADIVKRWLDFQGYIFIEGNEGARGLFARNQASRRSMALKRFKGQRSRSRKTTKRPSSIDLVAKQGE